MSAVALERNKTYFEQLVAWCPEPFKGLTQAVLWPFEQLLELVAGEPDDLMAAARQAATTGDQVRDAAEQHRQNVARLKPHWRGPAGDSFGTAMDDFIDAVKDLADGFDQMAQILVEAANASVEAFNLLCEIIFEFILWYLAELIIAAVAAAVSFGASAVAFAVRAIARLAATLGRMWKVIGRFAVILGRLATRIGKVAELLMKYAAKMKKLFAMKRQFSPWKKALYSRAGLNFQVEKFLVSLPGKLAINAASPINIPGLGGTVLDGVVGYNDLQDGKKDRNYVHDGTYKDVTGRYVKPVQDLIDLVGI
ncbi:WXG100 family type VII secretion target [Dactylosporangium sp. NPDC050588]|uniref:WXG100 family type VII secretion target n=1 Tax=Dactylosporangium sp. NPDC050588 TaxID=3157211 RepID=UPI0033F03057